MQYALLYVIGCFLVALVGINRRLGFWGYLFFSLLLTPIVGLITVLASDTRKRARALPVAADAGAVGPEHDEAARTYMARIDRLVASQVITRDYASRQLVPLLVRAARRKAGRGAADGQGACPLETILAALEALPMAAAGAAPSGPPAG